MADNKKPPDPEPDNFGMPENWVPTPSAPIIPGVSSSVGAPPSPYVRDQFNSGALPSNFGLQTDLAKTSYGGWTAEARLMPVQGGPGDNAKTVSIVTQAINAIPPVIIPPSTPGVGDGLTHGDKVWEYDPAYFILRDDFSMCSGPAFGGTTATQIGELGWSTIGAATAGSPQTDGGGEAGHFGQFSFENIATTLNAGVFIMNGINVGTSGVAPSAMALFDYPGWKLTWVWKTDGSTTSSGNFAITKKSIYLGLAGNRISQTGAVGVSARPDVFFGIRYDTSATPGNLSVSAVAANSGGNTIYTVTSAASGANGGWIGLTFVVTGLSDPTNNNGTFTCVQSTATALTLNNPNGTAQTLQTGTAAGGGLNDSHYTLEAVANHTYTSGARHNLQGTTLVTSVAPTLGGWHRLDIICNTAGFITMTLDGSATNTLTVAIPTVTINNGNGTLAITSNDANISTVPSTSGTTAEHVWTAGSIITVSGATGGLATPFNTIHTLTSTRSTVLWTDITNIDITPTNNTVTIVGFPAVTPFFTFGNDDATSVTASTMRFYVDYFSLVWNPNLGPNAPGTPVATLPRYWS